MIAALLLGRKGSVGFPGKNHFKVFGHSLSWYPMNAALLSKSVDKVYLSTDDEDLMTLAEETGVEVIKRPDYLCTKEALGEDAFKHGYDEICKRLGEKPEYVVLLFCNAPTLLPETIDEGVKVLRENANYDSAVTVSRYNMWSPLRARKIGDDGLLHPFVPFEVFESDTLNCDRDSQGDAWYADVAISVVRPQCLENLDDGLLPQKWMGQNIYPLKQEAGCDVDYDWQVPVVEWWLKKNADKIGIKVN
jgi:hypothetical protein